MSEKISLVEERNPAALVILSGLFAGYRASGQDREPAFQNAIQDLQWLLQKLNKSELDLTEK
jgi:hypothetical protein